MAVHVVDHPLVQHKITLMRRRDASTNTFRRLVREVSALMAYEVLRDVVWGKVSLDGARDDYGVIVTGGEDEYAADEAGTEALRAERRAQAGDEPFFDRGPGYAQLSGGKSSADVDFV